MRLAVATQCQENSEERVERVEEGEGMFTVYLVCAQLMLRLDWHVLTQFSRPTFKLGTFSPFYT